MGDAFRKVRDGERLKIPARTYNAMIDAAQDYINRKNNLTTESGKTLPANMVYVKNTTGAAVDRLNILGIGGSQIDPTTNTFKEITVLTGVTPSKTDHASGRFVITAEPIGIDCIGRAYVAGVTAVQINIIDEGHSFADIKDSDITQLESSASGAAVILYKEQGTGTKLAIVRFGGSGGTSTATTIWAKIIVAPTFQDPYAASTSPEYVGNGFYIVRLDSSNYQQWQENHDPPYTAGTPIIDPDNNRVYIKKVGEIQYPSIAPHANATDWDICEEIKIEYALGSGQGDNFEILVKDCVPVFPVGARVRITSRILTDQTKRYYLDETLLPVGEPEIRTISIVDGKVMAVFQ
jgi:hypothetical protein